MSNLLRPPPPDPCAVVLAESRELIAQIQSAVGALARIVVTTSQSSVLSLVRAGEASVIVIEAMPLNQLRTPATVASIRYASPDTPIFAWYSRIPNASDEIVAMVNAGVSGVLFRGSDNAGLAVRAALRRPRVDTNQDSLYSELAVSIPRSMHPFLRYAIARPTDQLSVGAAAAALGVSRKTLNYRLRVAGLPTPQRFLGWIRLIAAAERLDDPRAGVELSALHAGFPSCSALRNMLQRYAHITIPQLRAGGGSALLRKLLTLELSVQSQDDDATGNEPKTGHR
jgi:AraC-like DNA-binding protein